MILLILEHPYNTDYKYNHIHKADPGMLEWCSHNSLPLHNTVSPLEDVPAALPPCTPGSLVESRQQEDGDEALLEPPYQQVTPAGPGREQALEGGTCLWSPVSQADVRAGGTPRPLPLYSRQRAQGEFVGVPGSARDYNEWVAIMNRFPFSVPAPSPWAPAMPHLYCSHSLISVPTPQTLEGTQASGFIGNWSC